MPTLEELRNKLAGLNRRTAKANDIWKPKDKHQIRLLPYQHNPDEPIISLHFHYEIGDQSVLCPKSNYGDDCAICDFCDKLKSWKTPEGADKAESDRKVDWELFKKIQPKARVFVPMFERTKESEGPKFWGITPKQAEELLKECADAQRLELLEIDADDASAALGVLFGKKAFDLEIEFKKAGEKGNTKTYAETNIKMKIMPSAISKDQDTEKKLLEGVKNIKEVYPPVSSDEVAKLFKKFVGSIAPEDVKAGSEGGREYGAKQGKETAPAKDQPAPTNSKESAAKVGQLSIDDAFNEMSES